MCVILTFLSAHTVVFWQSFWNFHVIGLDTIKRPPFAQVSFLVAHNSNLFSTSTTHCGQCFSICIRPPCCDSMCRVALRETKLCSNVARFVFPSAWKGWSKKKILLCTVSQGTTRKFPRPTPTLVFTQILAPNHKIYRILNVLAPIWNFLHDRNAGFVPP